MHTAYCTATFNEYLSNSYSNGLRQRWLSATNCGVARGQAAFITRRAIHKITYTLISYDYDIKLLWSFTRGPAFNFQRHNISWFLINSIITIEQWFPTWGASPPPYGLCNAPRWGSSDLFGNHCVRSRHCGAIHLRLALDAEYSTPRLQKVIWMDFQIDWWRPLLTLQCSWLAAIDCRFNECNEVVEGVAYWQL